MVWIDGRLTSAAQAQIPVFDSAYLYGIGIFETLRTERGVPLFLKLHDERLRRNARRIGLRVPLSAGRMRREIGRLLERTGDGEKAIRIILSEDTRGRPRLVMIARPFRPYPARCYREGGRLIIAKEVQADAKTMAGIKTTSYLTKMLARREAKRRGADEAILLDANGHVTEGASSNIFVVKKGRLITPPLSEALLPGTRRYVVMTLARRLKIPVLEKTLTVRDLMTAEELFVTSSLKDVMPVGWVDGKRLALAPGPVTRRIAGSYGKIEGVSPLQAKS